MTRKPTLTLDFVVAAMGGTAIARQADAFRGVAIDGRKAADALYFAIAGERFDGHDFVAQAKAHGATGAVIARGRAPSIVGGEGLTLIEVDDTVQALGRLAAAHRKSLPLQVVGVAGSNGKTTTKEMIAAILVAHAGCDAVAKTEGNLNNHLGVPLTLLALDDAHRFAVVEMGMSALGELAYLTELVLPDVAIVVSIAAEHLEELGTLEHVAQAEAEIWGGPRSKKGKRAIAVAPASEPLLCPYLVDAEPKITFGERNADVVYDDVQVGPHGLRLRVSSRLLDCPLALTLPLVGRHNAHNAAAAATVALALHIPPSAIARGLAVVQPAKHRAQLVAVGDRVVLDDCYNASPASMRAALDTLQSVSAPGHTRTAVLADMLELGPDAPLLHDEIGRDAARSLDELITLGPLGGRIADAAEAGLGPDHVFRAETPEAAVERLAACTAAGDVILIKGSRGMRLERIIDALAARLGAR